MAQVLIQLEFESRISSGKPTLAQSMLATATPAYKSRNRK
jgi:hypothetical protein